MIDETELKKLGREFGIDVIRIAQARSFTTLAKIIPAQKKKGLYLDSDYLSNIDVERFCNIQVRFPWAKSIIIGALGYLTSEEIPLNENGPYGIIARYTWRNYYLELKKRLKRLAQVIKKESRAKCRIFSNGSIPEKPLARKSGVGYYGKNGIIINKEFGSWMVFGEIVTDLKLTPDTELEIDCGDCDKCIAACPTGAIIKPYIIDNTRCIQALSGWYGPIPDRIAKVWGNRLYGCTTCQDVCPKNRDVKPQPPKSDIGYVGPGLPLLKILDIEEDEYRRKYPKNQITASWIDFRAIKRNALIGISNTKDNRFLPVLKKFTNHPDPVIAQTAHWAINNLNNG